tara:strand:- start:601 stop:762 length:162 start_codon:yes stop_codon:yes gene_type:complete
MTKEKIEKEIQDINYKLIDLLWNNGDGIYQGGSAKKKLEDRLTELEAKLAEFK